VIWRGHDRCRPSLLSLAATAIGGCGLQAYAQDPVGTVPGLSTDPSIALLLDLLGRGGLPLVLVVLAWQARGALGSLTVTVELGDSTLRRLARRLRDPDGDTDDEPGRKEKR
jgi:hypothetical protein